MMAYLFVLLALYLIVLITIPFAPPGQRGPLIAILGVMGIPLVISFGLAWWSRSAPPKE